MNPDFWKITPALKYFLVRKELPAVLKKRKKKRKKKKKRKTKEHGKVKRIVQTGFEPRFDKKKRERKKKDRKKRKRPAVEKRKREIDAIKKSSADGVWTPICERLLQLKKLFSTKRATGRAKKEKEKK